MKTLNVKITSSLDPQHFIQEQEPFATFADAVNAMATYTNLLMSNWVSTFGGSANDPVTVTIT